MTRKANGAGSVSYSPNRTRPQRADLRVSLPGGARRRKVLHPHDDEKPSAFRDRCEKLLTEMRVARDAGHVVAHRQTVGTYAQTWIAAERQALARGRSDRRPSTITHHETILRNYVLPHLGPRLLASVTKRDVVSMLDGLADRGLRAGTIKHARISLNVLLSAAHEAGLIASVPIVAGSKLPKSPTPRREVPFPTAVELGEVLAQVEGERWEPLLGLLAYTGLRKGEALGLAWSDIDLDGATVSVNRSLVKVGTELVLGETKTRKSKRTLPLDPELLGSLRRWRKVQIEERMAAGPGWGQGWPDLLFTDPIGQPLKPDGLRSRLDRACKSAGVRHLYPHALRHGAASLAAESGATPHEVADMLGHANATLILSTYGHAYPERVAQATRNVGAAIRAARSS